MTDAYRLQVHLRGIAAITAAMFVVCGVLAMRHEASVPHVRDRGGAFVHGKALSGHHAGGGSDVHRQSNPDADAGECAVLTALHQAASADVTAPVVVAAVRAVAAQGTPPATNRTAAIEVYRLAPKTSPPVTA